MGKNARMLAVLVLLVLAGSSARVLSAGPAYERFNYLPMVLLAPESEPEPECPAVRVFDRYGDEQDWSWLVETFGAVGINAGNGSACVIELRDEVGPATITVTVVDTAHQPLGGIDVVWYWPGVPWELPPEMQVCYDYGFVGQTKTDGPDKGTVGFGMGGGSYYFPPDGGPHTIWVGVGGSDCLYGIGMLGGTNHRHLNPTFMLTGK
jgi:hypothetical protein